MMKKIRFWSIIMLAAMGLSLLTACGGDDSAGGTVNPPGGGITVNGKRLVAIKAGNNFSHTYLIGYNSTGQVIKFGDREYTYGSNFISSSYETTDCTFKLNNGRIVEMNCPRYELSSAGSSYYSYHYNISQKYTYDIHGFLSKVVEAYHFSDSADNGETSTITEFTWQDSNLIGWSSTSSTSARDNFFVNRTWNSTEVSKYTCTYTNYPYTIPGFFFRTANTDTWEFKYMRIVDYVLSWQGYFVNRCKNLPEKEIIEWESTIDDNNDVSKSSSKTVISYTYKFENDLLIQIDKKIEKNEIIRNQAIPTFNYTLKYQLVWE